MLTTRYHEQTCVVECDGKTSSGEPNLQCFAFSDGVLGTYEKHGLYNKDICLETTVQAKNADPTTDDPEMVVTSCPEFFLYLGWDRNVKRTLGNMRQEVQLKTTRALEIMIDMYPLFYLLFLTYISHKKKKELLLLCVSFFFC